MIRYNIKIIKITTPTFVINTIAGWNIFSGFGMSFYFLFQGKA